METIVVWGAGHLAKLFLEQMSHHYNVLFIVEGRDGGAIPRELSGVKVVSKKEYLSSKWPDHHLMICSTFFGEICSELMDRGLSTDTIEIAIAADYKVTVAKAVDLNPSLDVYIKGQKICRDFYEKQKSNREVITFTKDTAQFDLLKYGFELVEKPGLNLEFGVFKGDSIRFLGGLSGQKVYGFDSFVGLPEDYVAGYSEGTFDQGGKIPEAPENVSFFKGWFEETLPTFLAENPGPAGFLHMDADLYSSTIYVLNQLKDRIQKGTIIVFDEYNFFLDPTFAEKTAFEEFTAENNINCEIIGQTIHSVGFKIL